MSDHQPNQRTVLDDILGTPKPQQKSLDHAQPGALQEDLAHLSGMLERAIKQLTLSLREEFLRDLNGHIHDLASTYHDPKASEEAMKSYVEQEIKRLQVKTGRSQ